VSVAVKKKGEEGALPNTSPAIESRRPGKSNKRKKAEPRHGHTIGPKQRQQKGNLAKRRQAGHKGKMKHCLVSAENGKKNKRSGTGQTV